MRMNKKGNVALVPTLRFPEFRDSGDWEDKKLDELCDFTRGPFGGTLKKEIFVKNGYAVYEQSHAIYNKFDSFRYFITEEKFNELKRFSVLADDIIMSCSGTMGKFSIVPKESKKGVINQALLKLTVKKGFQVKFIKNSLELPINQEKLLSQSAGGAIKNVVSVDQIKKIHLCIPNNVEQQKITDCLTALDDLITAEDKKIEALKVHKKGLMQKLFPAEGATLPDWRFPDFRGSGDWKEKKFGDICKFTRGPFGGALKKEIFVKDGYAIYEQSHAIYGNFDSFKYFIREEKFNELKRFSVLAGDIIMSCSGTMGKFAIIPKGSKEGVINQALLKLTVNNGIDVKFAKMTLELDANQEKLLSQSAGGAIKNVVSVAQMKEIKFLIPHLSEQEKIADCLNSLEDLISAQVDKIEILKIHKKGLIQGLFPSIKEVSK